MVNKNQVFELHAKHPDWYAAQIAKALDCESAYVRSTARRYGLNLPKGGNGYHGRAQKNAKAFDLGMVCIERGITLADLLDFEAKPVREEKKRKRTRTTSWDGPVVGETGRHVGHGVFGIWKA